VIAVLKAGCTTRAKAEIVRFVEQAGFRAVVSEQDGHCQVGIVGEGAAALAGALTQLPEVEEVRPAGTPYRLVSREQRSEPTRVKVDGTMVGGPALAIIAGPCAVESREQLRRLVPALTAAGARILRGGAFKPRSSPYSFRGLGKKGLELLAEARESFGVAVVTEVLGAEEVPLVAEYADMLQVGARNMQNFRLLDAVGEQPRPVLLKRGMMATVEELLLAAEYVVAAGNPRVILCERGIRTFESATRATLDVAAVPVLKERTHLPVIVDPSHAAGRRELVPALALAAVAAGADGLMVEVHPDPDRALSDGRQSLTPEGFAGLMVSVRLVAAAVGRTVDG
jgi:3-deoxy-7-phosphoheptulonate synthase